MIGGFYNGIKSYKNRKNLMDSFVGESQARNKYTYFASKSRFEIKAENY